MYKYIQELGDRLFGGSLLGRWISEITSVGHSPTDTDEERTHKAILSLMAYLGFFVGMFVGLHDVIAKYPTRGLVAFSYSTLTVLGFLHFRKTKEFRVFRFSQLAMILTLPFIAQITHGGFILSGSSIVWSMAAPMCAVMFHGPAKSFRWFLAYFGLLMLAARADLGASQLEAAQRLHGSPWFFFGHLAGISFVIFILIQYFVYRLKCEQERSETLLLNILPAPIAERLKQKEENIADAFSEATILFADIAGFTKMSGTMTAHEVVNLLNQVFSAFDRLAEKYRLEKIKTIGDAYMVVGGLPSPTPDHARNVLDMALEMRESVKELNLSGAGDFQIRIGINTGPVVAGVIGIRKFIYDLWGDAVNVASRMESTGIEGEIQVTEATWAQVKNEYRFEKRENIMVKGKGAMTTYLLQGRNA